MFFHFSSDKIIKVSVLVLIFLAGVLSTAYLNNKLELANAFKLYTNKMTTDTSYWISHKLADSLNPRGNYFFLWRAFGYEGNSGPNISSGKARSIPVLAYHGLPNEGIGQIPNDVFVDQMKTLKASGWRTVTLEEFNSFIKGETDLPEKSFLLTFDDGRKDTFYPADPALRDLGFNAVVFVITKRSLSEGQDSTYYLSPYELREMEKTGRWEVESHGRDSHDWYYIDSFGTLGHYFSDRFWFEEEDRMETVDEFRNRVAYDLANSKKDLEKALGKEVTSIAYPFGDYGQDTINFPEAADIVGTEASKLYGLAFYQVRKGIGETFNYPEGQFMIKRIEPASDWTGIRLLEVMESGRAKNLPWSAGTFGSEWLSTWGQFQNGENLSLEAAGNTTGSSAILSGSYLWQDYRFSTNVEWTGGSNLVLAARLKDGNDYFGCNFGPNKVSVKESSNGVSRNLTEAPYSPGGFPRSFSLGIEVAGDGVSCFVNGEKVVEGAGVNTRVPHGSIGLEVWDERAGRASAIFDDVSVIGI